MTTYEVKVTFTEPVLGTVPKNKELYRDYIIERAKREGVELTDEQIEQELKTIDVLNRAGTRIAWILAVLTVPVWLLVAGLVFYVMFWQLSYLSVVDFCRSYDMKRQETMGRRSEYDLFERPVPECPWRRTFGDWIWLAERRREIRDEQPRE